MKIFHCCGLVAAVAAFGFVSCSQEDIQPSGEGVVLNIQIPSSMESRAYGDASVEHQLQYAVFQVNANNRLVLVGDVGTATISGSSKKTTITPNLANGFTYKIVFWAQRTGCDAYTFTAKSGSNPTVTVNYDNVVSCDENRDAFFGNVDLTVSGPQTVDVKLKRPFAQVNFGTSDASEPSVTTAYPNLRYLQTTLTAKAYNTLDLTNGDVSGEEEVTFALANVPNGGKVTTYNREIFPVEGYEYLSMNYLMVPKDQSVVDLDFTVVNTNSNTVVNHLTVASAPVCANYRTNLYGRLLTSTTGINVEIVPAFDNAFEVEVPAVSVETPEDFTQAMKSGGTVTVPEGVTITVPAATETVVTNPTNLIVNGTLEMTAADPNDQSSQFYTVKAPVTVSGGGTIRTVGYENIFTVRDQGSVEIKGVDFDIQPRDRGNGSVVYLLGDYATAVVEDCNIRTSARALTLNGGKSMTVRNVNIVQDWTGVDKSPWGDVYAIYATSRLDMTDVRVNAMGTAIRGVWSAAITLNDCDIYTSNSETGSRLITMSQSTGGSLTINGGTFKCKTPGAGGSGGILISSSDSYPLTLEVNGGKYTSKILVNNKEYEPVDGYVWETLTGEEGLNWQLVK